MAKRIKSGNFVAKLIVMNRFTAAARAATVAIRATLVGAAVAVSALSASAEGYQVNTFSARQDGMGHVGVALKLGSESVIFNPGAVAFSEDTFEISGGVSAIKATATAKLEDGQRFTTSNKASTPFNVASSFRIYDNFYGGVALYTPYGSSINWGKAWPGAVLNQSVDLKLFTLQPTLSWRPIKNLSVGAGLMITWGSVNLTKGLVSSASMNRLVGLMNLPATLTGQEAPYHTYGHLPPASVNLQGSSEIAVGYNIGIMWEATRRLTFGASFRSKMEMKVQNGDAQLEYGDNQARDILGSQLDILNEANFNAAMPAPYVLTVGVAYKPIARLTLAFDAQLNGWKTYKQLAIEFPDLPATFSDPYTKNYHNAMTWHLGAEYNLTRRLDLRAGLMVDCSPVNDQYYNPETPGMTKVSPSVGLSFRPVKGLSVDVAFMYVHGCGASGSNNYKDLLAPAYNGALASLQQMLPAPVLQGFTALPAESNFSADYRAHALIPALGVSYSF